MGIKKWIGSLALVVMAQSAMAYNVGVSSSYFPNIDMNAIRAMANGTGAWQARIGIMMQVSRQYPGDADPWVELYSKSGRSGLGFLINEERIHTGVDGKPESGMAVPEGLWLSIFDNGKDQATPGAKLNPKNEWAFFVGETVTRYKGKDAASDKMTYFSIWNEPDWMLWPARPQSAKQKTLRGWWGYDYHDLARLAFISHTAGKWANPRSKIGLQLCYPESLGFLLDDAKYPLQKYCDFVDYHAYAGPSSDANVYASEGLLGILAGMQKEYKKRNFPLPQFLCTENGVVSGPKGSAQALNQAAAIIKSNVAAASAGLITMVWYSLADPSWENMGLIDDVSTLPRDAKGYVVRESYVACNTVAQLITPKTRYVGEVAAGPGAHVYRFDHGGRELLVAWADDRPGVGPEGPVSIPMNAGTWKQLAWNYSKTRKVSGSFKASGKGTLLTLQSMPVFLVKD